MYVTISEAAQMVGVHPSTVRRWLRWGKVPPVPRDRNGWRLFDEEEVRLLRMLARANGGRH